MTAQCVESKTWFCCSRPTAQRFVFDLSRSSSSVFSLNGCCAANSRLSNHQITRVTSDFNGNKVYMIDERNQWSRTLKLTGMCSVILTNVLTVAETCLTEDHTNITPVLYWRSSYLFIVRQRSIQQVKTCWKDKLRPLVWGGGRNTVNSLNISSVQTTTPLCRCGSGSPPPPKVKENYHVTELLNPTWTRQTI